jgi:hypothetical protein
MISCGNQVVFSQDRRFPVFAPGHRAAFPAGSSGKEGTDHAAQTVGRCRSRHQRWIGHGLHEQSLRAALDEPLGNPWPPERRGVQPAGRWTNAGRLRPAVPVSMWKRRADERHDAHAATRPTAPGTDAAVSAETPGAGDAVCAAQRKWVLVPWIFHLLGADICDQFEKSISS